ncbi:MAG: 2-amino-4-hydroxy-6-hydroxymethyldihydropteridine diphosphokinase [Candidatus Omnitrophica bacterium]|jgi:2-amino-4-hydroxy-6-hydroxymethyldihydropteridine diphosphokinase|nr:2-amino-4-hydroxy-6-hydroxymethyldihydropteridine diphosphokinase [Candidatus Omnitrophota bacterium]
MEAVFIAIGSNLGNREENIEKAIGFLRTIKEIEVVKVSALYRTEPQESIGPEYLNGVVKIKTRLTAQELLRVLQDIELKLKRVRSYKNAPRTIDLDILLYGKQIINSLELTVPHPRMLRRDFVMKPLLEIEPEVMGIINEIKSSYEN